MEQQLSNNTLLFYDNLLSSDMLLRVGRKTDNAYIQVSSWKQAYLYLSSDSWEETQLEARNHLTAGVVKLLRNQARSWNSVVGMCKSIFEPVVSEKLENIADKVEDFKTLKRSVTWDLVNCAIAIEVEDLFAEEFYHQLGVVYLRGHLPCGWEGEWPEGGLVIF